MSITAPTQPKPGFFSGIGCWASLVVIASSLFLYVIACILPAMVLENKDSWRGIEVLVLGWQGVFLGQFAWFANPFWMLSLLLAFFRRWILTSIVGAIALLIAFDAFSFVGAKIPLDEAFVNTTVFLRYDFGFYFWLGSLGTVMLGALAAWGVTAFVKR